MECCVCLDILGTSGGPVTLPCGHNGCFLCFTGIQETKPECPLCRQSFDSDVTLPINRDLQQLINAILRPENDAGWILLSQQPAAPTQGQLGMPSAPPMPLVLSDVEIGSGQEHNGGVFHAEPPSWEPDNSSPSCRQCESSFSLLRPRHHCRLCGGLYCNPCSKSRLLLPPKFCQPEPQRVCQVCASALGPLQPALAEMCSLSSKPAVHNLLDDSVPRTWFNVPFMQPMDLEIFKCANIVRMAVEGTWPSISSQREFSEAKGLVILSSAKAGMGWSLGFGSGLLIKRVDEQRWSLPSAIACTGFGWGLQAGVQVTDVLLLLKSEAAVNLFCQEAFGDVAAGAGVAIGSFGLQGSHDMVTSFAMNRSRGVYAGLSLEGMLYFSRPGANHAFYGRPVTARQLLYDCAVGLQGLAGCQTLIEALAGLSERERTIDTDGREETLAGI